MAFHNFKFLIAKYLTVSFLLSVFWVNGISQNLSYENIEQFHKGYKHLLNDSVNKRTEIDNPFVLGRKHTLKGNNISHPYFSDFKPVNGSLVFKNKTYQANGLQYDIRNDKLIYRTYPNNIDINYIALDENFIPQFSIYNSTFRYFEGLETKLGRKLKNGYYEVVYDGEIKFLVRWEKTEGFDINVTYKLYNLTKSMFVLKGGHVTIIKSKAQLLSILKDKKQEVKKFIKNNNMLLKLNDHLSVIKVLSYYESIDK